MTPARRILIGLVGILVATGTVVLLSPDVRIEVRNGALVVPAAGGLGAGHGPEATALPEAATTAVALADAATSAVPAAEGATATEGEEAEAAGAPAESTETQAKLARLAKLPCFECHTIKDYKEGEDFPHVMHEQEQGVGGHCHKCHAFEGHFQVTVRKEVCAECHD